MRGTPFRKNLGDTELSLGGDRKTAEVIPSGSYAAYLIHQVHFDPDVYADPEKFDPERYEDHRAEHKKVPHGYLGWGSGRHPCCKRKIFSIISCWVRHAENFLRVPMLTINSRHTIREIGGSVGPRTLPRHV